jgi:adenosyl cobinamide kinase/adenosyl cobinamide phosphate guanylyltransferase
LHFITGGAFNGKRAWVKKIYQVEKGDNWISAYENHPLPICISHHQHFVILEGIEIWLKYLTEQFAIQQSREFWNSCLNNWLKWEKEKLNRKLIVIGSDITKGIVPLEKENRIWRDLTGWAYQDTAAKAEKVDVIWYGLNQTMKRRENVT